MRAGARKRQDWTWPAAWAIGLGGFLMLAAVNVHAMIRGGTEDVHVPSEYRFSKGRYMHTWEGWPDYTIPWWPWLILAAAAVTVPVFTLLRWNRRVREMSPAVGSALVASGIATIMTGSAHPAPWPHAQLIVLGFACGAAGIAVLARRLFPDRGSRG